jgi:hypothetical protein
MVDYRKFLKSEPEEVAVLFLGGLTAHAFGGRALRLTSSVGLEPGWYRVRVRGRGAELLAQAEPESLEGLPSETGHFACGYVGMSRGRLEFLERLGAAEPEALAPLRARRHPTGALLLDEALFEGEPEALAREALEAGRGLSGVKGVTPSLRAAFALATARAVARERGVSLSAAELDKAIPRIADDGRAAAHALLDELTLRREEERARVAERARGEALAAIYERARATPRARAQPPRLGPEELAERALTSAGALLLGARRLGPDTLEVRYQFLGERFTSVVHPETLHVFDAGICLAGADEEVTLESLPSVIREAIEDGVLVITRR